METRVHRGPLIIGGGLAGLSAALEAVPVDGVSQGALVVTPAPLLDACASAWAQGGMAAALGAGDSPQLHARDTEAAGAGLVEAQVAQALTGSGRETVEWLAALGAPFDRDGEGGFAVSREAAHSMARVARVGGDGAGRAILSAVVTAARKADHIEIWEDGRLRALVRDSDGRVRGAVIERTGQAGGGHLVKVLAQAVVLATGGVGGLFEVTTNPSALKGEGMALAYLAGAEVLDPEFVQFHPTAIDVGLDPAPLATEALRGEGARLVDADGQFLIGDAADADLAARDIVARAVHQARVSGRGAYLDASTAIGSEFEHEFPAVFAACMAQGIDPRVQPIPVAAAVHYHMGGIAADDAGRTSVAGLYAVGECAATGVHGANRLASNSLLEAACFGRRAGRLAASDAGCDDGRLLPVEIGEDLPGDVMQALRVAMSASCGVVRDAAGLAGLAAKLDHWAQVYPQALSVTAAQLIVRGAQARCESRGGHFRADYPQAHATAQHTRLTLADFS